MASTSSRCLLLFTLCGALASSVGFAGCGGGSGGGRPGSGGATASGGAPGGTGGAGGGGAPAGTGGAAACMVAPLASLPLSCSPGVSPSNPLITDFKEGTWNNTAGKWGCGLTGSLFSYNGAMAASMVRASVDLMARKMVLMGNVEAGDYGGGGLSFEQCVNTTAYSGVQFTLGGTTGGCDVVLQVQTFDAKPTTANPAGGCTVGCYSFPQFKLPATTGSVTVPFASLTGGKPTGVGAAQMQMIGLQWQLQSPPPPPR